MKYFELDKKEEEVLEDFDKNQFTSIPNAKKGVLSLKRYAKNTLNKTKNINIRLTEKDLQKNLERKRGRLLDPLFRHRRHGWRRTERTDQYRRKSAPDRPVEIWQVSPATESFTGRKETVLLFLAMAQGERQETLG